MNDFLRNFLMQGIRNMIDNDIELYKVYQYAAGWYSKDVLTQEDLQEIENLYSKKEAERLAEIETQKPVELATEQEITEENTATEEVQGNA